MLLDKLSLLGMQVPTSLPRGADESSSATLVLSLLAGFVAVVLLLMLVRLY